MWGGKWFGKWFGKWMGSSGSTGPVVDPDGIEIDVDLSTDFELEGTELRHDFTVLLKDYTLHLLQWMPTDDVPIDMDISNDYEIEMPIDQDLLIQSRLEVDHDMVMDLSVDHLMSRMRSPG